MCLEGGPRGDYQKPVNQQNAWDVFIALLISTFFPRPIESIFFDSAVKWVCISSFNSLVYPSRPPNKDFTSRRSEINCWVCYSSCNCYSFFIVHFFNEVVFHPYSFRSFLSNTKYQSIHTHVIFSPATCAWSKVALASRPHAADFETEAGRSQTDLLHAWLEWATWICDVMVSKCFQIVFFNQQIIYSAHIFALKFMMLGHPVLVGDHGQRDFRGFAFGKAYDAR